MLPKKSIRILVLFFDYIIHQCAMIFYTTRYHFVTCYSCGVESLNIFAGSVITQAHTLRKRPIL